ncbi:MAG: SAM-dependent chlorinase/fluorinase, partial [Planctomycetota bacterium]
MARAHPVFLLTDFGLADVYVGVLKGVLLRLAPDAPIADLTHAVPPQDLGAGAFQLFSALPWLPEQAVVCVVVDPGVGTTRGVRLDRWAGRIVVSPDNGLVAWAFALLEAFRPPLEPAPCSCVLSDAVAARLLAGERPGTRRLNGSRKPGAG